MSKTVELDAMSIAVQLRDSKRLFARPEIVNHLGIGSNQSRWDKAIKKAIQSGFVCRFGNYSHVRYCHADYAKDLQADYDKFVVDSKQAVKDQRIKQKAKYDKLKRDLKASKDSVDRLKAEYIEDREKSKPEAETIDAPSFKRDGAKFIRTDAESRPDKSFFAWFKAEPKRATA